MAEPTPAEQAQAATPETSAPTNTGPASAVAAASDNPTPSAPTPLDIDSLSLDEMDAILSGKSVTVGGVQPEAAMADGKEQMAETAAPEAVVPEVVTETPAGVVPPVETEPAAMADGKEQMAETEPPAEKKDVRMRLNTFPDVEQEAILLRRDLIARGQNVPLQECIARVEAKYGPTPGAKDEATPPEQSVDTLAPLRDEVAAIETKLDEAGGNEGLFNKDIAELTKLHSRKVAELAVAEHSQAQAKAQTEANAKTAFADARTAARAKAVDQYPDAANPESPLGKRAREMIAEMQDPQHPDHEMLLATNALLRVTQLAALELGITPKAKGASAPTTPPPSSTLASPPKVQPASGSHRTTAPTPQLSEAQLLAKADDMSVDELDALIFKRNGSRIPMRVR